MPLLDLFTWDALQGRALSSVLSVLLLALAFVPLERAFKTQADQPVRRRGLITDALFLFGQHLVWGALAVGVLAWLFAPLRAAAWLAPVHATTRGWPVVVLAGLAMVGGDLTMYLHHRLQHRVPLLWRFHAVHHTAEQLDWVAAHREHPVDGLMTQACMNLPAVLLGLPLEAVMGLITFRGLWSILIHANVTLPLGPLAYLLGAPRLHRWHHARDRAVNFGNLAPWADVLFGTHHDPGHPPGALGLADPAPAGYGALLFWPFRRAGPKRPANGA